MDSCHGSSSVSRLATNDLCIGASSCTSASTVTMTTSITTEKKRIKIKLSNNSAKRDTLKKRKVQEIVTAPKLFSTSTDQNGIVQATKMHSTQTITSSFPPEDDHFENLLDDQDLMDATSCSDALFAMKSLLQQHQYAVVGSHNVPFVLRNMIHAVMMGNDENDVGASTVIGQELDELVQQGKVRMIKLLTRNAKASTTGCGADACQDVAVFEESLFRDEVQRIVLQSCENQINSMDRTDASSYRISLAHRFSYALQRIHTMHVTEGDLIRHMTSHYSTTSNEHFHSKQVSRYSTMDWKEDINELLRAGVLIPKPQTRCLSLGATPSSHVTPNTVYYLSLPGMGEASRSIDNGRQELLLRIKRSMHKEMKQSTLLSKPMKSSSFSSIFHLKDLLSSGKLSLSKMPCGIFIKLGT